MAHQNKKLSVLHDRFIPKYIRESYTGFATLIQKYFEYLERTKGEYDLIANLLLYGNVDDTIPEFFDDIRKQNLENIPEYALIDQYDADRGVWIQGTDATPIEYFAGEQVFVGATRYICLTTHFSTDASPNDPTVSANWDINPGITEQQALAFLVKNIRDFHQSKGSQASYDFIFRAVWDTVIEFYYPRNNMLIASDGKWTTPRYLELKDAPGAGNILVSELDNFLTYKIRGVNSGATAYVQSIVSIPKVDVGRARYPFYDPEDLTLNQQGAVVSLLQMVGTFEIDEEIQMIELPTGVVSQSAYVNQLIAEDGAWENSDGFISWDMYLQDNDYYQNLSYEIRGSISKDVYEKVLNDTVHPAGTKMFSLVDFGIVYILVSLVGTTSIVILKYLVEILGQFTVTSTPLNVLKNHEHLNRAEITPTLTFDTIEKYKEDLTAIVGHNYSLADDFNDVVIRDFETRKGINTLLLFENGVKVPFDKYNTEDTHSLNFIDGYVPANSSHIHMRAFNEVDYSPHTFNTAIGTAIYTLPFSLNSKYEIIIFMSDGTKLAYSEYSVSGSTLTLTTTPTMVEVVEVFHIGARNEENDVAPEVFTTVADQNWYTLNNTREFEIRDVLVWVNGIQLDYSTNWGMKAEKFRINGTQPGGDVVEILYFSPSGRGYYHTDEADGLLTTFYVPFNSLAFDYTYAFDVTIS